MGLKETLLTSEQSKALDPSSHLVGEIVDLIVEVWRMTHAMAKAAAVDEAHTQAQQNALTRDEQWLTNVMAGGEVG